MNENGFSGYGANSEGVNADIYFAADSATNLASTCIAKSQSFYNTLNANYYLDKLITQWSAYHGEYYGGLSGNSHTISMTGEEGELSALPVNHYRNIAEHIINMIASNRPVMETRAINSDYKSVAQTVVANGILDYYMREKNLEVSIRKVTEMAVVLGCSYLRMEWNATAGDSFDADDENNEIIYKGEAEFSVLSPFDVVFDGTKDSWNNDWLLIRTKKNRYDLIAKYPEHKQRLLQTAAVNQVQAFRYTVFSNDSTDDIYVYEFFHKRTEALPQGRYTMYVDTDIILMDIPIPYRKIPIFRLAASEFMGTPYAYSPMFDMFPIQEGINSLYSSILTNQSAFAVQNLFVKNGSDVEINSLQGSMNIITGNEPPVALQLCATPPEVFKFLEMLIEAMETISGVNSVTRGNPEASLKSGTALALVQSMSLQFISGLQNNYVKFVEEVGTGLINILQDYAGTKRTISIVGKSNAYLTTEFDKDDINSIGRVVVSLGNPLAKCLVKDTPILMFDGTIKMVQDIVVGDRIMGPDSKTRTVNSVNSGSENLYEITSKDKHRDVKYGVNESHILTLKYCSDDSRYNAKKGDVLDISVRDYLKLTDRQKRSLQGFKTGVEFQEKNLSIPPYILGAWLGDGHSACTALTTADDELLNEWTEYADSIGLNIRISTNNNCGKAKIYFITSGKQSGSSDRNIMLNHLKELNVYNNKHIPQVYLTASRHQRLELLAGILDTDGCLNGETFVFTQKNKVLTDNVIFLAQSLGFRVTSKKQKILKSLLCPNVDGYFYKVTIGGNTWEIPCKIPRKQSPKKEKIRDWLNYGINVVPKGVGEYFGFTLEEEPHFVLGDFSVTHNTTAGRVQMAEQLLQMGLITNPKQYLQIINTGEIESLYDGDYKELMNIKRENELMMAGQSVMALFLDTHKEHILEHRILISDPDLRQNQPLLQNVLNHIQEHIDMLRTVDPDVLLLTNQVPLQNPGMPQMPPGMPPEMNMGAHPPMGNVMQQPTGMPNPPKHIQGAGNPGHNIPQPARPAAPFQNLPTNPSEVVPQG